MVNDFGLKEVEIDKQPILDAVSPVFNDFGEETRLTDIIKEFQES